MAIFGMKTKKLAKFGQKVIKAGLFGAKNGGRLAFGAGTPKLAAAGSAVLHGIEKVSR